MGVSFFLRACCRCLHVMTLDDDDTDLLILV